MEIAYRDHRDAHHARRDRKDTVRDRQGDHRVRFSNIQILAIIFVPPVVMILALERAIGSEAGAGPEITG